ncbi:MAG TPA: alpha-ketoglutarate decarboxylase [Salinimicrobium sp.]|nr:alpha-ketoglutarate decarboxylase [Salinimicrobium sp.]
MTLNFLNSKKIFSGFFLIFLAVSQNLNAQDKTDNFWSHVRFGGSIGASFGNDSFYGFLAPSAIYDFNQYFSAGVGLQGSLSSTNSFKASTFGGSLLTYLSPLPVLRLSAEFELLQVNMKDKYIGGPDVDKNYMYPALFLGAGYRTGPVTIGLRYDVLYDEDKSIYSTPLAPFVSVYF